MNKVNKKPTSGPPYTSTTYEFLEKIKSLIGDTQSYKFKSEKAGTF